MADIYRSYSWGHRTREAAQQALWDMLAECEISESERPKLSSYKTPRGRRWAIQLLADAAA